MRTIDADALKKTLKGLFFPGQLHHHFDAEKCAYNSALNDAMERIRNAPSIEAVPVVHARWVWNGFDDIGWECSHCKHEIGRQCKKPTENYCSHCGARMDGDPHDSC